MTRIDPHYFDGWERRVGVGKPVTLAYCRCGHVNAAHFQEPTWPSGGELDIPGVLRIVTPVSQNRDPYRCHGERCHCHAFTEDRRLWSKIKRKVGRQ